MKFAWRAAAAAGVVLLSGCSTLRSGGAAHASGKCGFPNTKEAICVPDTATGKLLCQMQVLHSAGSAAVFPYALIAAVNRPARIVWTMRGGGTEFRSDDGPPELKADTTRFSNASPTSDPKGATPAASGRSYRIDFDGSAIADPGISYSIQFTDISNTSNPRKIKCDPLIVNEAG